MMSFIMKQPKLTTEHLNEIITSLVSRSPNYVGKVDLVYGLAIVVLRFYLGKEWVNTNVFPFEKVSTSQARSRRSFLRTESSKHEEKFEYQDRVIKLAEFLFNLCSVEGFEEKLEDLRNKDLEAVYSELQCAGFIAKRSIPFRFVTPSGTRGCDYDVEMLNVEGKPIPTEIKTKVEGTAISMSTIKSSLDAARRQLPSGCPGVAFVKIPEAWVSVPEVAVQVAQALEEFFKNTGRVVAIVFLWEEWKLLSTGQRACLTKFRVERNEKTSLGSSAISIIFGQLAGPPDAKWTNFLDFARQYVQ